MSSQTSGIATIVYAHKTTVDGNCNNALLDSGNSYRIGHYPERTRA